MLIEVATAGNGSYTRANGLSIGLDGLISQLNNITKGAIQTKQYKTYNDQFQVFLLLGLLLLFVDSFVLEKKKPFFNLLKKQQL